MASGAGTNLKGGAPVRSESGGHISGGNFFGSCPPLFGSKSTISRFGERFRGGQYSLVSWLLFFYSRCPRAQPFVKVGARAVPCPVESAPLFMANKWRWCCTTDATSSGRVTSPFISSQLFDAFTLSRRRHKWLSGCLMLFSDGSSESDKHRSVADLEWAEPAPPLPLATEWRRHSRYSWYETTVLYYGDTIASFSLQTRKTWFSEFSKWLTPIAFWQL